MLKDIQRILGGYGNWTTNNMCSVIIGIGGICSREKRKEQQQL